MTRVVIIRNPESGFVLEDICGRVSIEFYHGLPSQQWLMVSTGNGSFAFRNNQSWDAIDISSGDVVTNECYNLMSQHWYVNHDGTIQNSTGNLVLCIYQSKLRLGNKIVVSPNHGGENQHFIVQPLT